MRTCPGCGYENRLRARRCVRCGTPTPPLPPKRAIEPGALLGRIYRYLLESPLARGRHSEIWMARDLKFRRTPVALEILKPRLKAIEGLPAAMKRAVRRMAPHTHPNVTRVFSFEKDELAAFLVTEYVEGPPLSDVLKARRRISEEEALWVVWEISTGLRFLHGLGLPHGGLNLSNLMLRQLPPENRLPTVSTVRSHPHQCVKICGWLTARLVEDFREGKRRFRPMDWSPAGDIRALGKILYRLIRGRAFPGAPQGRRPVFRSLDPLTGTLLQLCLGESRTTRAVDLIAHIERGKEQGRER